MNDGEVNRKNQAVTACAPVPRRNYKARVFEMLFHDKRELLSLYNAANGTSYDDPEALQINTLENALYLGMKNDVSFIIDSQMSLYEHQSTYSPNLPLRYLMYVADVYSGMITGMRLYGSKPILIPEPHFIIFYNGEKEQPERKILRLSDLYQSSSGHERQHIREMQDKSCLELTATMLNINTGHNEVLKKACRTLSDYVEYTNRVRNYKKELPLEEAVERAVNECIAEGILTKFLMKNKAEVVKMSIYEYDMEEHMRMLREESREEGREEGREEERNYIICNLSKKISDIKELADLVGVSEERVLKAIGK